MPQMSPMWWELLYILFIFSFLIINSIMHFYMNMSNKNKMMIKNCFSMNWKW
uniref:ATP synthase F0 subunit 8 n=1 Tax=Bochrus foveatus TaxID=2969364 RepID=UPI0021769C26|nr:ATP synthase F0 subunit 8 [Bochrus foveatus]UUJ37715.1 ATP synthase F0 subunit 8 [Bochrus foveatus]